MNNKLIVENRPNCEISEYIRKLRTNIQSQIRNKYKTIMVTSSIKGEGKSFITSNLAASFAKICYKVLIIDVDIKNPTQHKIFNRENSVGISEIMDDPKLLKKYIKETDIKNVSLIMSGKDINNFNEKLVSEKFKTILEILKDSYDLILIDCPSIKESANSIVVSNVVDKILIVSAIDQTTPDMLKSIKQTLKYVDDKILGLIVNKVIE